MTDLASSDLASIDLELATISFSGISRHQGNSEPDRGPCRRLRPEPQVITIWASFTRFSGQRHVVSASPLWRAWNRVGGMVQRWQVMAMYSPQPEWPQFALSFGTEPVISSGSTRRYAEACAKFRD